VLLDSFHDAFPTSWMKQRLILRQFMNDLLEGLLKDEVVAHFKEQSQYLPGAIDDNYENPQSE
jgi:hypothetical protein